VTNLVTGNKILINDPNYSNAIKSYRVLKPRLTHIARNGPNVVVDWAYGTPPFQLQFKSSLTAAVWSNIGAPTTNRTATVSIQPGAGFFRVSGQ
jgi:hypothetical protein